MALCGKTIIVVLPAYNASKTLEKTIQEIPEGLIDRLILVDDASVDNTISLSQKLHIETHTHPTNRGYGGNQKTCYHTALRYNPDIIAMLHPDYQYTPLLLRSMCSLIAEANYDFVLGSRILVNGARKGGMPFYKYIANRFLTFFQNLCLGNKLSEYHSGYRVYRASILQEIAFERFSDDFIFDNQMIAEILLRGYTVGEVSCPTRYFAEASSINLMRSTQYGFGVLSVSLQGILARLSKKNSLL